MNHVTELTKLINESNDIVKWLLFSQVTTQMNMSLGTSFLLFMILRGTLHVRSPWQSHANLEQERLTIPKVAERIHFFARFFE